MARLNLHRVFAESLSETDYLTRLTVPRSQEAALRSARDEIRSALKLGFADWRQFADRRVLIEASALRVSVPEPHLRPKFRMQGSASQAYRTLNAPAHNPPQQIDYDDGVYLPVSFLSETGNPVIAAAGYFVLVETILAPLCRSKRWSLDRSTSKCVRVILDHNAHIDLPLYAIPDQEFNRLVEDRLASKILIDRAQLVDAPELDDELYERLGQDEMRLALRQGKWKKSDPRQLEVWFKEAIATHGPQLRRVSRYLKGWRDFTWTNDCKLSSIVLMKCAVDAFDSLRGRVSDHRDDLSTLEVAARLEGYFSGKIRNPVLELDLNDNWSQQERQQFRDKAIELHSRMHEAIYGTDSPSRAISSLTKVFGPRIPNDTELVTVTAESIVRSIEPTKLQARQVPRTTSG